MIPSGFNDRYEHWRIAMALLVRGVASVLYDARLAGESSGEALPSHYYARSQVRATDAAAVASFARSHPRLDSARVGVLGWSQGGWLGSIVSGNDPEVAFYVNIAGNLNPGWQQQRHARLSDLRYEGFSESEVEEARRYFDVYFGLMHGEVPWAAYVSHRDRIAAAPWFRWLEEQGFSVAWDSPDEARGYAGKEKDNVPERDLTQVTQPALGIYFQFDESSPPDSAVIFVRGLMQARNPDLTLRTLPGTSHEGWVVKDYQRAANEPPTRLAPEIFRMVADWIAERALP
jgi:pimeloyl-ACP methyl ester carboxylesterase